MKRETRTPSDVRKFRWTPKRLAAGVLVGVLTVSQIPSAGFGIVPVVWADAVSAIAVAAASGSSTNIKVGEESSLEAALTGDLGAEQAIEWSSSAPDVATVTVDGTDSTKATVSAVKPGTADITAILKNDEGEDIEGKVAITVSKGTLQTSDFTVTTPTGDDLDYSGSAKSASVTNNVTQNIGVTVVYQKNGESGWDAEPIAAGKYNVGLVVAENDYYETVEASSPLKDDSWNFTIAKKAPTAEDITLTGRPTEDVAKDDASSISITAAYKSTSIFKEEGSDKLTVKIYDSKDVETTAAAITEAGEYKVKVDAAEGTNSAEVKGLTDGSWTFKVVNGALSTIIDSVGVENNAAGDTEINYGDTVKADVTAASGHSFDATEDKVTYQWLRDGVAIDGATSATYQITKEDVGKAITVKLVSTTYSGEVESEGVTPEKAVLGIASATVTAKDYNGEKNDADVTISFKDAVGSDTIDDATVTGTYAKADADTGISVTISATTLDIKIGGEDASSYYKLDENWKDDVAITGLTGDINKKSVTVTDSRMIKADKSTETVDVSDKLSEYGTLTGTLTISSGTGVLKEAPTFANNEITLTYEDSINITSDEKYEIAGTLGGDNYTVTLNETITFTDADVVELSIADVSKTYDGTAISDPDVTNKTTSETISDNFLSYEYYTDETLTTKAGAANGGKAEDVKDAGTYYVKVSYEDTANNKKGEATATITIDKAEVTASGLTQTLTVGDTAEEPTLTGLVTADELKAKVTITDKAGTEVALDDVTKTAGDYDVEIKVVDNSGAEQTVASLPNYTFPTLTGKITVTEKSEEEEKPSDTPAESPAENTDKTDSSSQTPAASNTSSGGTGGAAAMPAAAAASATGTEVSVESANAEVTISSTGIATYMGVLDEEEKVVIPASVKVDGVTYKVTAISARAFAGDDEIVSVSGGKNIKTIGASAFADCTNLKSVTLGKNITSIGKNAFKGCESLKKIKIYGNNLKKVAKNAFKGINKNAKITVLAKDKKTYNKAVKLLKKAGAKKATYTYKKSKAK